MQLSAVGPTRVREVVYEADKGDGVRAWYKHKFTRPPRMAVRGRRLIVSGVTVKPDRDRGQRTTGWLMNPPGRKHRSRSGRRPSPAQLRARAAFVKMVRARAKSRRRVKTGRKRNPYEVTQAGRPTRHFGTSGQAISHVRSERRLGRSPSARFVARNPRLRAMPPLSWPENQTGEAASYRYKGKRIAVFRTGDVLAPFGYRVSSGGIWTTPPRKGFSKVSRALLAAKREASTNPRRRVKSNRKKSRTSRHRTSRRMRANPPKGGHMARRKSRRRVRRSHRKARATRRIRRHRSTRRRVRSHRRRRSNPIRHRARRRVRRSRRRRHSAIASNPVRRHRRRSRRRVRSNPISGGGFKKYAKMALYAGIGVGLIYATNWGLEKIDAVASNPKLMRGIQTGAGVALVIGAKMMTKSWLFGLLVGGPLAIYGGYKHYKEMSGGASLPAAMGPSAPGTTKGVGDYVNEDEAATLPAGSEVMDASTGETYTVGDPTMVGAAPTMVGGFPMATVPSQGVGGFPLATVNN